MTRAEDYKLDGLRLLLIHRMVGQVISNINDDLGKGKASVDISQFSEALEGSADLLLLSPEKLLTFSRRYRPSAKGKKTTSQDADEAVAAGLKEAAAGIRAASDAIAENQPDGLPYFAAGLIVSWNAALSVINSSLRTLIQQYPGISPVLTKEDHRIEAIARTHGEEADRRDDRMWSALEEVLARMAQRRKKAGEFDPRLPPSKAEVARDVSDAVSGLGRSTVYNRIYKREIEEIWTRLAD